LGRNGTGIVYALYELYANMISNFEDNKEIDKNASRKE
jgi:hypothetical protein